MADRVSQETLVPVALGSPNARVSQETLVPVALGSPKARVSQETLVPVALGSPNARVSGLWLVPIVPIAAPPAPVIFPALIGLGYPVQKAPEWATDSSQHASGIRMRAPRRLFPIWKFKLTYDALASNTYYPGPVQLTLQTLMGFLNDRYGSSDPFLFLDPTDCQVTNGTIGVGTGSQQTFTLVRTLGSIVNEPVGYVFGSGLTAVYLAGVLQNPLTYFWTAPNLVTFYTAPALGVEVSATFTFYFQCTFTEDTSNFEEMMSNLWSLGELGLTSLINGDAGT